MFDLDLWLLLSAITCLCLQACITVPFPKRVHILSLLFPLLAFALGDWLSHFSVLNLHQVLASVASVVAVCLLLESLLLYNQSTRKIVRLMLLSPLSWLAFVYLQMRFYQTGWLDLTFHYQALVYGVIVGIVYWLVAYIARLLNVNLLVTALITFHWCLALLTFSRWPIGGTQMNTSGEALIISLAIIFLALLLGYGRGFYQIRFPEYKK